jgi:hypothetical protein
VLPLHQKLTLCLFSCFAVWIARNRPPDKCILARELSSSECTDVPAPDYTLLRRRLVGSEDASHVVPCKLVAKREGQPPGFIMYGLAGLQSVGHVLYLHIEDTVSSAVLWASCHQGPHSVGNLHLDPRMPLLRCLIKQGSVIDNKCDAPAISCIIVFAMLYPHMTIVTGDSRWFF